MLWLKNGNYIVMKILFRQSDRFSCYFCNKCL